MLDGITSELFIKERIVLHSGWLGCLMYSGKKVEYLKTARRHVLYRRIRVKERKGTVQSIKEKLFGRVLIKKIIQKTD